MVVAEGFEFGGIVTVAAVVVVVVAALLKMGASDVVLVVAAVGVAKVLVARGGGVERYCCW